MTESSTTSPGESFLPTNNTKEIQENELVGLHFPSTEVLYNRFDQYRREKDLQQARILSSVYKQQVSINFEDVEGPKIIQAFVKGLNEKYVQLNNHLNIPIHRIVSINY